MPLILTGGFSMPWLTRSFSLEPLISLGKCKHSFEARLLFPQRIAACISSSALSSKSSRSSANALDCGSFLKSKYLLTVEAETPFISSSAVTEPLPSSAISLSLLKRSFSRVRLTSGVVCVSSTFVDKLPCLTRPFDSEPMLSSFSEPGSSIQISSGISSSIQSSPSSLRSSESSEKGSKFIFFHDDSISFSSGVLSVSSKNGSSNSLELNGTRNTSGSIAIRTLLFLDEVSLWEPTMSSPGKTIETLED